MSGRRPQGFQPLAFAAVSALASSVSPSRIREVNRVLEDTAWGAYRTEFYPTYDYKAVGMAEHEKATH